MTALMALKLTMDIATVLFDTVFSDALKGRASRLAVIAPPMRISDAMFFAQVSNKFGGVVKDAIAFGARVSQFGPWPLWRWDCVLARDSNGSLPAG